MDNGPDGGANPDDDRPTVIEPVRPDAPDDAAPTAPVPAVDEPVSLQKRPDPRPHEGMTDWDYETDDQPPVTADPIVEPPQGPPPAAPPIVATLRFATQSLTIVGLLALGFLLQLTLLGSLQHDRNQAQAFAELRIQLAEGTAPVGPLDEEGAALVAGTPIGILEIPRLGLQEVVLEGPTSRVLMSGPAHRRDTVFPGQAGTSIVLGRRGGYGGPFRAIDTLSPGNEIIVTTGQGRHVFSVVAVVRAGDPPPPPVGQGGGRIALVTTAGPVYQPTDIIRVVADLTTPAQQRGQLIPPGAAPANEEVLAGDSSALLTLMLWGPLLVAAAGGVIWVRFRAGRWQAWIIGVPVLGLFGSLAIDSAAALLPNIL